MTSDADQRLAQLQIQIRYLDQQVRHLTAEYVALKEWADNIEARLRVVERALPRRRPGKPAGPVLRPR
jgi:prefoldin subunit 5